VTPLELLLVVAALAFGIVVGVVLVRRPAETGMVPLLADLRERLAQLGEAARRVSEVHELLQVPKLRGTLGEVWLEELLGQILPHGHFEMQYAFRSGERVDAVLRIGDRLVPVDAKFPLEAWQRGEPRTLARSLKARIDEIADRYIRPDEGTFDFALMYIPAEAVYYEAVVKGGDTDGVLAHAMSRRVIPVSPHTFYAYLLVIVHGLKGLQVEARARELVGELGTLGQQFEVFWATFEKMGTHLANAAKQYAEGERQVGRVRERFARIGGPEPRPLSPSPESTGPHPLPASPQD
jgi:DNA recombination protein RmuC